MRLIPKDIRYIYPTGVALVALALGLGGCVDSNSPLVRAEATAISAGATAEHYVRDYLNAVDIFATAVYRAQTAVSQQSDNARAFADIAATEDANARRLEPTAVAALATIDYLSPPYTPTPTPSVTPTPTPTPLK